MNMFKSQYCCSVYRLILLVLGSGLLLGCSTKNQNVTYSTLADNGHNHWVKQVVNYQRSLPNDLVKNVEEYFFINENMRQAVVEQFSGMSKNGAAQAISQWLLSEHGRNMQYDVGATLLPISVFQQKRGNCLSFTMLLVRLAAELDIQLQYNQVEIPNLWSMDDKAGMVSYRHVNSVSVQGKRVYIYDLAANINDLNYPQKRLNQDQVVAMFESNLAVQFLKEANFSAALHSAKLAVSFDPTNADMWVNLGVIKKRMGDLQHAEDAFLQAYKSDHENVLAASHLERLYRQQGSATKAQSFARRAQKARLTNPYVHYYRALDSYQNNNMRFARKHLKKALRLHDQDARFYELRGLIAQKQGHYQKALASLKLAELTSESKSQGSKYASKKALLGQLTGTKATGKLKRRLDSDRFYQGILRRTHSL